MARPNRIATNDAPSTMAEDIMGFAQTLSELVDQYEDACNTRDVSKFRKLLALDDPRFREIEDHIDAPFGAHRANEILKWIEDHPDSGYRVHYCNVEEFALSDHVGYVIAQSEWRSPKGCGSGRVTFVCIRNAAGWRILHGHWSNSPA